MLRNINASAKVNNIDIIDIEGVYVTKCNDFVKRTLLKRWIWELEIL